MDVSEDDRRVRTPPFTADGGHHKRLLGPLTEARGLAPDLNARRRTPEGGGSSLPRGLACTTERRTHRSPPFPSVNGDAVRGDPDEYAARETPDPVVRRTEPRTVVPMPYNVQRVPNRRGTTA